MTDREKFEKWYANKYDLNKEKQKIIFAQKADGEYDFLSVKEHYIAWQEATKRQQKKIDDLKLQLAIKDDVITGLNLTIDHLSAENKQLNTENPDVPCPACGSKGYDENEDFDDNLSACAYCNHTGTVPLTKALEYRIKELEEKLTEVMR